MTFPEAMLLGLLEIKFSLNTWLSLNEDYDCEHCGCLVGAALYAVGERQVGTYSVKDKLDEHWPGLMALEIHDRCPVCTDLIGNAIGEESVHSVPAWCTHLSIHYMDKEITAEAVADWLSRHIPREQEKEVTTGEKVLATVEG